MAVIGAGSWGRNLIRVFNSLDNVHLEYIHDIDRDLRDEVARKYPGVKTPISTAKALEDDNVDAVVVATPSPAHYDIAMLAVGYGKHVFVEKPMTMSVGDAQSLVESAANRNVKLMVGHLLEYHPAVELMALDGSIGRPFCIHTQRLNDGIVRTTENAWWSLAPHDISVACYLFNAAPETVSATSLSHRRAWIPDMVWATLVFPDNRVAHIHVSWSDSIKTRKITMVGPQGTAIWDDMNKDLPLRIDKRVGGWAIRGEWDSKIEPLKLECQHFIDCIVNDETPRSDGLDGLRVVKVLATGEASLREGGNLVEVNL